MKDGSEQINFGRDIELEKLAKEIKAELQERGYLDRRGKVIGIPPIGEDMC